MTATLPPPPPPSAPPAASSPAGPAPGARSRQLSLGDRIAPARHRMRAANAAMSPAARALAWTSALLAGLALWLVLFGLVISGLFESHAQTDLYAQFRSELANGVAPLGGAIGEGAPVALLSSPAAGLDDVVAVEGSSASDLRDGPGHRPGTPLPGQAGNAVIYGRATSYGAPFSGITRLHGGDTIRVTTGEGAFTYIVQSVHRPGDPAPAPLPAGQGRLTLETAGGNGWRSGWAPSYGVYVDAILKGDAAVAPAQGSIPSERDNVFARDTRGMYPLVLWLQLLLLAAVGGVVLRSRWGGSRAWMVMLPIGLAALTGASNEAWLLLPNLL